MINHDLGEVHRIRAVPHAHQLSEGGACVDRYGTSL
jgi:hypothetical protein